MGHVLENTIESVQKAIELNVDGIEIDVFKSKTGELVAYHDPFLSRLSNSNAFIEQISLDSIKKIELIKFVNFSIQINVLLKLKNLNIWIDYNNINFMWRCF